MFRIILMVVAFPAPFGPSSPETAPFGTASERALTAVKSAYRLVMPRMSRARSVMVSLVRRAPRSEYTWMPGGADTIRFDRNEVSGAFGDLGTSLPLIVGMIVAARLDATSVLVAFGALQIFTGLVYRMPMPVQPLKAVAAIVIAQQVGADVVYGGGLAIGLLMLVLAATGLLDWLPRLGSPVAGRGSQWGRGGPGGAGGAA